MSIYRGLIVAVSGPSGVGKGTVLARVEELLEQANPGSVGHSISVTTRAPRGQEKDGVEYFFRTKEEFEQMIADGKIGEIKRTNWIITNWYRSQFYYDTGAWRATWVGEGGGVLYNQAPHQLDLFQWIVGMMPTKVHAFCHFGKWHDIEVEDDVSTYVEYENGATGVFITSTGDAQVCGDGRS